MGEWIFSLKCVLIALANPIFKTRIQNLFWYKINVWINKYYFVVTKLVLNAGFKAFCNLKHIWWHFIYYFILVFNLIISKDFLSITYLQNLFLLVSVSYSFLNWRFLRIRLMEKCCPCFTWYYQHSYFQVFLQLRKVRFSNLFLRAIATYMYRESNKEKKLKLDKKS